MQTVERVLMAEVARFVGVPAWQVEWVQWHVRLADSPRWRWAEFSVCVAVLIVVGLVWLWTGSPLAFWQVMVMSFILAPLVGLTVNRWERRRVRRAIGPRS